MTVANDFVLNISQSVSIKAAVGDAYAALIRRLTSENSTPDNKPLPMVLEEWPGGRWFRDLGNGQGHLWGFVQVIKPPTLIEIHGPLFMSYAVAGHVQFRIEQIVGGAELELRHQVLGSVDEEHQLGMHEGWRSLLEKVKQTCEA